MIEQTLRKAYEALPDGFGKVEGGRIYYKEGFKYKVTRPCEFIVDIPFYEFTPNDQCRLILGGGFELECVRVEPILGDVGRAKITLLPGYAWDGGSGPAIDTKNSQRGSALHDAGYFLMRQRIISQRWRYQWDDEMYKVLREDGMWSLRARWWRLGVRTFAARRADPANARPELVAP